MGTRWDVMGTWWDVVGRGGMWWGCEGCVMGTRWGRGGYVTGTWRQHAGVVAGRGGDGPGRERDVVAMDRDVKGTWWRWTGT